MILHSEYNNETGLIVSELIEYNKDNIERSKKILENLKKNNIFFSSFNNIDWILCNEYEKVNLNFNFDEVLYIRELKNREMYKFYEFVNSVKSYIAFTLSKYTLVNINENLRKLKKYIITTDYFNKEKSNKIDINYLDMQSLRFIEGYLNFVKFDGTEYYNELLEEQSEYLISLDKDNLSKRRCLSDFQSIFLFNKIIQDFWKYGNDSEKNIYLPLYIWWIITNIIPLRLKEFCITPYDCIEFSDNKYYIKLRRSKIKGRRNTDVKHKIEDDYNLKRYIVTKEIADLILKYKEITQPHRQDYKFLLCYRTHRYYIEETTNVDEFLNNTFRRETLSQLFNRFFIKIIQNKYEYNIVTYDDFIQNRLSIINDKSSTIELEFKPLDKNEITMFRIGDIRHFALINMVLNDINPILVKELVDHENINTTFHYFGNIDELVRCMSYIKYKELCDNEYNENQVIGNLKIHISANKVFNELEEIESVEVDNGRCMSKYFIEGKLNNCVIVDGECDICDFFIEEKSPSKEEIKMKLKVLQSDVQRQAELIENLLKTYKSIFMVDREIDRNNLRLQTAIESYQGEIIKNGRILWEE